MNNLIISTVIVLWMYVVETIFHVLQLHKRRPWEEYFALLLIIIGTCYAAQAYGKEVNLRNPIIDEETTYLLQYEEHYFVTKSHNLACKFVPQGTPAKYVNEDGTPSHLVWNSIRMCDRQMAKESLKLHREKCQEYFYEADRLCIYLPETTTGHKIKAMFTSYMSTVVATGPLKICIGVIAIITQYGVDVYDEYEKVMFNLNMCKWHYNVSKMFEQYISEKGW